MHELMRFIEHKLFIQHNIIPHYIITHYIEDKQKKQKVLSI